MKVVIKRMVAAVVFMCILVVAVNNLGYFFRPDDMNTESFGYLYKEDDDTLNVACIGSSAIYRFWIPQEAYEKSGFTSALVASAAQDIKTVPYLMDEILRTQDVDLFVVEVRQPIAERARKINNKYVQKDATGSFAYVATSMKQSADRVQMIDQILVEDEDNTKLEWWIPLLKYHDNSHTFTADQIVARLNGVDEDDMYVRQASTITVNEQKGFVADTQYEFTDEDKRELDLVAAKAEELGKKVLFVATPYSPGKVRGALHLQMNDYIEQQGYDYLDLNQYVDQIGLDFSTDYYDDIHTNIAGAQKVTAYLANYLSENYDLKSRLDESQTAHWESMCKKWDKQAEELMKAWEQEKAKGENSEEG